MNDGDSKGRELPAPGTTIEVDGVKFVVADEAARCGLECTCQGVGCGLNHPNGVHCQANPKCPAGCKGHCQRAPQHPGVHACTHWHSF